MLSVWSHDHFFSLGMGFYILMVFTIQVLYDIMMAVCLMLWHFSALCLRIVCLIFKDFCYFLAWEIRFHIVKGFISLLRVLFVWWLSAFGSLILTGIFCHYCFLPFWQRCCRVQKAFFVAWFRMTASCTQKWSHSHCHPFAQHYSVHHQNPWLACPGLKIQLSDGHFALAHCWTNSCSMQISAHVGTQTPIETPDW